MKAAQACDRHGGIRVDESVVLSLFVIHRVVVTRYPLRTLFGI